MQGTSIKRVFIIGQSHFYSFFKPAIYQGESFATPLGDVKVDNETCTVLAQTGLFEFNSTAHANEHSIEVQLPFLQAVMPASPVIVPILLSKDIPNLNEISEALKPYFNKRNLFVISTDLSHYPDYETAYMADNKTIECICQNSLEIFETYLGKSARQQTQGISTLVCGEMAVKLCCI
ncbi:MAG: AmmeMemoRadiSam system protein B [Bacteroidales bacterium]|nr:AmmeMemoRadiSam system protein B [Bacteroidales bacterium]